MIKKLRAICLILITVFLLLSLMGCADSKTLKKDQYQIFHNNNSFTIKVTDIDINAENIERVKVTIKYKYGVIDYGNSSIADIKVKTETETFEVEKSANVVGNFIGGFTTEYAVTEFECKKAVAYYAEGSNADNGDTSVLAAIGYSVGCFVIGLIIWFVLALKMTEVNVAFYIAVIPYVICFIGMLVTGQWIPALIFFIGIGAFLTLIQTVFQKFVD